MPQRVVTPAVLTLVFAGLLGAREKAVRVGRLQIAMGPQIGAAMVAVQHGLGRRLIASMAGVGIPLSFVTVPAWHSVFTVLAS